MKTYEVTAPDGKTYEVTAPDGATEQQVLDYAKKNYGGASKPAVSKNAPVPDSGERGGDFPAPAPIEGAQRVEEADRAAKARQAPIPAPGEPSKPKPPVQRTAPARPVPGPSRQPAGANLRAPKDTWSGESFGPTIHGQPPAKKQNIPGPSPMLNLGEGVVGMGETAIRLGSDVAGGLASGARRLYGMATGERAEQSMAAGERVQRDWQFQPRTSQGKQISQYAEGALDLPARPARAVADYLTEHGHGTMGAIAEIGLDPYTYLGLVGLGIAKPGLKMPKVQRGAGPRFQGPMPELTAPGARPGEPPGTLRTDPSLTTPNELPPAGGRLSEPGAKEITAETQQAVDVTGIREPPTGDLTLPPGGKEDPRLGKPRMTLAEAQQAGVVQKPRMSLEEAYERGIAVRPDPGPGIGTQALSDLPPVAKNEQGQALPANEQPLGYTPIDAGAETDFTASESITSDVRAGGQPGGQQFENVGQVLHWSGQNGPLDRFIFNAGRAYKTAEAKDAAFNNLYAALRNLPAESRAPYSAFYSDKGEVIPKNDVISRAVEYHTALSTELNNAREANEAGGNRGQSFAIHATPFEQAMQQYRGGSPLQGGPTPPKPPQGDLPLGPGVSAAERPDPVERQMELTPPPQQPPQSGLKLGPGVSAAERTPEPKTELSAGGRSASEADFDLPAPPKTSAKKKGSYGIDYNKDSLLAAISKMGGINREAWNDLVGEKIKARMPKETQGAFKVKGKDLDTIREALAEQGYIPPEALADDGGLTWLREAIRDEANGTRKAFSNLADEDVLFGRMRDESEGGMEPGSLGANPFANPAAIKQAWKDIASVAGKVSKPVREFFDAVQTAPDSAMRAVGIVSNYAREMAAAKEMARRDMNTLTKSSVNPQGIMQDLQRAVQDARNVDPKYQPPHGPTLFNQGAMNPKDMIADTEHARRHAARVRMQTALMNAGYASPNAMAQYHQLRTNIGDLNRNGKALYIRDDAAKVVDQMVGAHDLATTAAYNDSLAGKWEAISHGAITSIMWNPGFHAFTVGTRALPFAMAKVRNNLVGNMIEGERYFRDRNFMYDAMKKGLQPMASRESVQAMGSNVGLIEKWMKSNNITGTAYDWYQWMHNNVMVDTVNRIQTGVYLMKTKDFMRQGMGRQEAELAAARFANTIAGNLPREDMGRLWHHVLGSAMFSRSYTSTVTRNVTRALNTDKMLAARLKAAGKSPKDVEAAVNKYRTSLQDGLVRDYVSMQVIGNVMNYFTTALSDEPDRNGKRGGHFTWENTPRDQPAGSKPRVSDYLMPDRIFLGRDAFDKPVYISNPLRTTRDMILFAETPAQVAKGEPPRWLLNKLHPLATTAMEATTGRDQYGKPLDESAAWRGLERSLPLVPVKSAKDAVELGSLDYFTAALSKPVTDLLSTAATIGGLQPHTERSSPTSAVAGKQREAEQQVWAEVMRYAQQYPKLDDAARKKIDARIEELAKQKNIDRKRVAEMHKFLRREGEPSTTQRRQARRYELAPENQ